MKQLLSILENEPGVRFLLADAIASAEAVADEDDSWDQILSRAVAALREREGPDEE